METTEANLARPPVVGQTEWDAALAALLERERSVAAAMHELAAARKRMPMVRVEHDYAFEGPDGRRSLLELFDGRSQLILYRFFFEEGVDGWPDAGCVGCSSVDEWFGFNVFLRDGNDVYRTYFLQHGAMVQWIGSLWSLWSLTPYGGQSDDEDFPEGWTRTIDPSSVRYVASEAAASSASALFPAPPFA